MTSAISIIIPVLNEELTIRNNIEYLNALSSKHFVIFVDGNSSDSTVQTLKESHLQVITSPIRGRGAQLSFGGSNTTNTTELILFLHIDTKLPQDFDSMIARQSEFDYWGRFNVKLDSNKVIYKIIQFMMNARSKITGIATGDQAIFVSKSEFMEHIDEMIEHPLMEDIYLSKVLKSRLGRGQIIKQPVTTSVRYWENSGIISTMIKMWTYRAMYFFGVSPKQLYQRYYK
ncbi:MAG: TIGR04283 family arsenosugar biosynthesis glycosyltransferase [Gammaproteobacteria bacterium]